MMLESHCPPVPHSDSHVSSEGLRSLAGTGRIAGDRLAVQGGLLYLAAGGKGSGSLVTESGTLAQAASWQPADTLDINGLTF